MQYNAYAGPILGNEWVPIREENLSVPAYSPNVAYGQHLELNAAYSVNELRWHIKDFPSDMVLAPIVGEIYPAGTEDLTGPIKRILIPASNATTTGSSVSIAGGTGASALWNPTDFLEVRVTMADTYATNPAFTAYFAGSTYATALAGKRILGINVLYTMNSGMSQELAESQNAGDGTITMELTSNIEDVTLAVGDWDQILNNTLPFTIEANFGVNPTVEYFRIPLGLGNPFWNGGSQAFTDFAPWIPADLSRFEISGSNRLGIKVTYSAPSAPTAGFSINSAWEYMALEVFYCEENRLAVGINVPATDTSLANWRTALNVNRIVLRDPITKAATPSVGPGPVAAVIYSADVVPEWTDQASSVSTVEVEALRQLYPIPTLGGLSMRMPYPYDPSIEGQTFEAEASDTLPHLTLHTTSAVIAESHPYGRQSKAEVFGAITAGQEIMDSFAGGAKSYTQARFYARRFGDTNVPLTFYNQASPSQAATITPATFDDLPEILDGWKEVTLRFGSAVTMGTGTIPQWNWAASGELPGNRWEILGASAPALSGIPGNNFTLSAQQLGSATYGAPVSGSQVSEFWYPGYDPIVTVTTEDQTSDATVLFSTDPQTPSGLLVSSLSQALSGAAHPCPVDPSCIPTSLYYNRLSWTLPSGVAADSFDRTVASGWGVADTGQTWSVAGVSASYSVNGTYAVHSFTAGTSGTLTSLVSVGSADQTVQADFNRDVLDTSSAMGTTLIARATDTSNFYQFQILPTTAGLFQVRFQKVVAGVTTSLTTLATIYNLHFNPAAWYRAKFQVSGSTLSGKVWATNNDEPDTWNVTLVDTSLTTGNLAGLRSEDNSAGGPAVNVYFDNFSVQPAGFGAVEIQRYDPVDAAFSTIMLSTNAAVTGFNDYEARVGQQSVYRIRQRNVYDFAGTWSTQVSGTVPSPGVAGASTALTIFTTNSRQDGSSNLAYSAAWEGNPIEEFNWVEASQVTYQSMYLKDYPTAFHPLERGGEAFSRTILVNAAGVPAAVTLNGFRELRDMAWDAVPYICVRDELGNRWYASVTIPRGTRSRMTSANHLDMATVNVAEVSAIPYPVDP